MASHEIDQNTQIAILVSCGSLPLYSIPSPSYLIPLFTHRGRPLTEFCPPCCHPALVICYKCRPEHDKVGVAYCQLWGGNWFGYEVVSFSDVFLSLLNQ